jgi:hypothetical protein
METNKEKIAVELNAGDLYLVIITARVPETNLRREREKGRRDGERLCE